MRKNLINYIRKDKYFADFKLPFDDIERDLIVCKDNKTKNTTYKMCLKISPLNTELETEESLEVIAESIKSAFSAFRSRYGIYIMSEKVDIKENLKNVNKKLEETKKYKDKMKNRYVFETAILLNQKEQLVDSANFTKSILSFYVVVETTAKSIKVAQQSLNDMVKVLTNELESVLIFVKKLNRKEIINILANKIKPDLKEGLNINRLKPKNAILYKNGICIKIVDKYYRFYAINNLPNTVEKYCWLKKLFKFNGDINISIICNPKRKDKVMKQMSKSIGDNEAIAFNKKNAATQKKYLDKAESARAIIDEISREDVDLYDVNIIISICADTLDDLDSLQILLLGKLAGMYMKCIAITHKEFIPFYTILPILDDNIVTEKLTYNLTSDDISSIIPFDQCEFMQDKGVIMGENMSSGGIVVVDYRDEVYNNSNMAIIADSGCGKTTYIKTNVIRGFPYTDYTIVFDLKGDFNFTFCDKHKFSPESGLKVNPFHMRNAFAEKEINVGMFLNQKIMDLVVFFKWIIIGMTPFQEALIEEDIRDSYKICGLTSQSTELPKQFCTFSTFGDIMRKKLEQKDLTTTERENREYIQACLKPYITGAYSSIFNGQTNWSFGTITILDISNTPEAIRKPIYDILLKDVWQFCKESGTNPKTQTRKDVYVDEAHEFADENNIQTFKFLSRKLVKEGRGFGVRTITATQNLSDFLALRKWGQGILDNSFFKIFMRFGETDIPLATKLYNFSKPEMRIIKGEEQKKGSIKGKAILSIGRQKLLIKITPTSQEWKWMG